MKLTLWIIFPLLSMLPGHAFGQNTLGFPLVHHYDKTVFQGGSRTWDIKQDSRGILYFANNEGLITFDGSHWKQYPLPNHTILRSLYIDEQDRIFAGGQGEFGYFEGGAGGALHYTSLTALIPLHKRKFADVWNTAAHGGSVFFRTSDRIFEFTEGRIVVHPATTEWRFLGYAEGRLFAQDREGGLLEFNGGSWSTLQGDNKMEGAAVAKAFSIGKDSVFFATISNGTYLLAGSTLRRMDKGPREDLYTPSLSKLSDSTYAVATSTAGCLVRDIRGRVIQRIAHAEGLPNNNVSAVFADADQNIWVGVDNAIAVISYNSSLKYFRPNLENDVTGFSTRVFEENLYVSSSNGVYQAPLKLSEADHSFCQGSFSLVAGSDRGEAWRLEQINGQLLLAHNSGIFRIRNGIAEPVAMGMGSWIFLPLSSALPVAQTLVGTYQGLDMLSYANGRFWNSGTLSGPADSYRFLEQEENGDIWAAHPYRGIYRLRISADNMKYDVRLFTNDDGLPSPFQNYVFKINDSIVFATEAGVYEFDSATQRFSPSPTFAHFHGIPIKYLRDDADGNVWFCSGKKVGVARHADGGARHEINYFPEIEGLHTSGFENIYPYDRHNIYIGSEKGIIHINYEKYKRSSSSPPKVLLSSVKTAGKKDSTIFGGYFAKSSTNMYEQSSSQIPKLHPAFDSYHFVYGSPSYGISNHVTYSYRLEGYDTDWSPWSTATEKHYTNLPSGTYTFKLKARKNPISESEIIAYTFVINPPWYKTVWAMLSYFAASLAGIYLLVKWQKKAWRNQQLKYERQLAQMRYIHQLEIEKNEKEIVKLQNEKLENEVLTKTKELASASMHLMENSGALSKLRVELAKLNLSTEDESELKRITSLLKDVERNTANWDQFASYFDELNDGFLNRLKATHPALSRNDLKVCAYLRLGFSSKQIAQLQNISVRGIEIHRYRLRKKLSLHTELSLNEYLTTI
ncbi:triple tyrosine motif-containing protein [Parapedobacter deserti]|uniref:Triple tyrosine motif-containing protein n=1 Tax=Parapedobacter deserti TaxID=1912957 RepID=A0ABV7JGE4_9SPHI